MSYERLEQAINALFLAEKTLKDNVSLFEQYITDKSIPLTKRWDFWCLAPDSIKGNGGWISDGRLEAFSILGWNPRDAIAYDGPIYAERYETFTMEGILECVKENWFDCGNEVEGESYNWDDHDFGVDAWEDFPVLTAFITAFKEEVLRKNIQSFKYDW
jgi:hypothetical protein